MLCMNYMMCLILAVGYTGMDKVFETGEGFGTAIGLGVVNGILFLASFVLLQINVRRNGVVLSATFMKLGVLVPTLLSVIAFREKPEVQQVIGFLVALLAIVLINFEKGQGEAGFKIGLILRGGSSGGGQDIIGILCAKKYPGFSVGKIGIIMNIGVYGVCMMLFDMEVVIYSLIYATVVSLAIDKIHIQNINMSVMIFTKKLGVAKAIMEETGRGVTNWEGTGAYTKENTEILYVVISKYEVNQIKRIVQGIDPKAFMIFTEGTAVTGNFEKRL